MLVQVAYQSNGPLTFVFYEFFKDKNDLYSIMIGKLQTKTNFNEPFAQLKIELANKLKKPNVEKL